MSRLYAARSDILTIRSGDRMARRFAEFGDRSRVLGPYRDLGNPASIAIGHDVKVWPGVALEALAPPGTVIIRIGDRCEIGYDVRFVAVNGIHIGDDVAVGHGTTVADSIHDWKNAAPGLPNWKASLKLGLPLTIGKGAWIGNGCVITGGITIGEGAIVGANSVVTRDVPPVTIVGGNPARAQRRRNGSGEWEWLVDPATLELDS